KNYLHALHVLPLQKKTSKIRLTSKAGKHRVSFMNSCFVIVTVVVGLLPALVLCLVEGRAFTVANGRG
ncbi:MAG: hypothetical protein KKD76_05260, partial [Verrucomicrobia bacterium]|nr:hypothetical protein [Verrucomicrobiota bacterium]